MLKRIQEPEAWEPQINQAAFEALDMAIEALSEPSRQRDDLIKRQDVYDLIDNWDEPMISKSALRCEVEYLPSAHLYTDEEIQTIQDLEQAQFDKAYELGWKEGRETLEKDAIDVLEKSRFPGAPYVDTGIRIALREIKALPSAQPDVPDTNVGDLISRQDALKPFCIAPDGTRIPEVDCDNFPVEFSVKFIKKYLRSLPSAQPEPKTDGDTISRQDAIDAADRADYTGLAVEDVKKVTDEVVKEIKKLPSAQPEIKTDGDTISRQDAIDALKGLPTWWADGGGYYGGAQPPMVALLDPEDAVSAIENLPSEQPERKRGIN